MTKEDIALSPVGLRFNTGKPNWSLMNYKAMEPMLDVLAYGAKKYARENWQKGLVLHEVLESMQRHLAALMDGETHDEESTLWHIGHIQCNAMFYSYFTTIPKPELKPLI